MKLGEENQRLKSSGPPSKPPSLTYKTLAEASSGQHVGGMDDDSSIIAQPSKTPSCGACRTRESKKWWKAPKGLPTNILCDTCGSNWRKYADLNVRQFREESAPLTKTREKREGTPIAGPSSKRVKVGSLYMHIFFRRVCLNLLFYECRRLLQHRSQRSQRHPQQYLLLPRIDV